MPRSTASWTSCTRLPRSTTASTSAFGGWRNNAPNSGGAAMRLTEEQRLLRDTAREFARRELAPHAAEWDREARFPKEALAELGRLGFMGVLVPEEYGGAGADHVGYALALEEIAAGDGS